MQVAPRSAESWFWYTHAARQDHQGCFRQEYNSVDVCVCWDWIRRMAASLMELGDGPLRFQLTNRHSIRLRPSIPPSAFRAADVTGRDCVPNRCSLLRTNCIRIVNEPLSVERNFSYDETKLCQVTCSSRLGTVVVLENLWKRRPRFDVNRWCGCRVCVTRQNFQTRCAIKSRRDFHDKNVDRDPWCLLKTRRSRTSFT